MQKNKKRKGFTLTELAIVIAVIAILIAVLVPTFVSLINDANESADQQAVKSMNTALSADEAINGKPDSASEAVDVLEAAGFNVENYQALESGNTIYYDLSYNRCLIWSSEDAKVTYPSDMVSAYSSVTGIAANWYTFETIYNIKKQTTTADDVSDLMGAITDASSGETVIVELADNTDLTVTTVLNNGSHTYKNVKGETVTGNCISGSYVTLDLNDNTLTMNKSSLATLANGATLYIKDGTLELNGTGTTYTNMFVTSGCSVTLENVEVTSSGSVVLPAGNASQVNIINSNIYTTGTYCVGTNAATLENYGVSIYIENSTLEASAKDYGDSCTVMINVEGTLNISNSTIKGTRQGVVVRAGTANITNTTIACSMDSSTIEGGISNKQYTDILTRTTYEATWKDGNEVAMGAVVVGNDTASTYAADAILTMSGCTLSYEITGDNASDYADYEIGLYLLRYNSTSYKTVVSLSNTTIDGKVIDMSDSENGTTLTGYTGAYTTWNKDNEVGKKWS